MIGVAGVAALGHIVVFGIVAPVEAAVGIGFIHSCVVVYGQQMYMGDSQFFQVINANRVSMFIYKPGLGEGQVLALILRSGDLVGEVAHMDLPDNCFGILGNRIL